MKNVFIAGEGGDKGSYSNWKNNEGKIIKEVRKDNSKSKRGKLKRISIFETFKARSERLC